MPTIGRTDGSKISHRPIPPPPIDECAKLIWFNYFRAFPPTCSSLYLPAAPKRSSSLSAPFFASPYSAPALTLNRSLSFSFCFSLSLSLSFSSSSPFSSSSSSCFSFSSSFSSGLSFLCVRVTVCSRQPILYLTQKKKKNDNSKKIAKCPTFNMGGFF